MARKAPPEILNALNDVLTAELTAINQYFIHAKMCGDWGYAKLHDYIRKESIDEMRHAETLIDRILYLNGIPNVQRMNKVNIGETVKEQFELDVALEYEAIPRLQSAIQICRAHQDEGTRLIFQGILVSEEEHIDWLEAQLELIKQIGLENYLSQQIYL